MSHAPRLSIRASRATSSRHGFSLLEILLAVALATMLMVAVNFFVLSMGELWGGGSESRLFERHVRGVTRFLESLVQQSVVPQEDPKRPSTDAAPQTFLAPRRESESPAVARGTGDARPEFGDVATAAWSFGAGLDRPVASVATGGLGLGHGLGRWAAGVLGVAAPPLPPPDQGGRGRLPTAVRRAGPNQPPVIGEPGRPTTTGGAKTADDTALTTGPRFHFGTPGGYDGSPPMLMFEVDEAPGQCVWPQRPLPQVECALQVNADEGLVLLWKSKLEEDYGKGRPRKTQLSPFARSISFDYYDADRKSWTHADQPQADGNGGWLVPQRVRVTFAYQGLEREVSITLPDAPGGAPLR